MSLGTLWTFIKTMPQAIKPDLDRMLVEFQAHWAAANAAQRAALKTRWKLEHKDYLKSSAATHQVKLGESLELKTLNKVIFVKGKVMVSPNQLIVANGAGVVLRLSEGRTMKVGAGTYNLSDLDRDLQSTHEHHGIMPHPYQGSGVRA